MDKFYHSFLTLYKNGGEALLPLKEFRVFIPIINK
jgi:hypothetical protein